ncbi:MAG: FtsL-like putative cell division protein [Bacteroidota bacterium]
MPQNTYKEVINKSTAPKKKSKPFYLKILESILNGDFLTNSKSSNFLSVFFFVGGLSVFLIANNYYAQEKLQKVESLRNDITELRTIYISNKSELMTLSNQSFVAKILDDRGFVESNVPPVVITDEKERNRFFSFFISPGNR